MTHSLSLWAADSPPAMYRRATLATLVSSTSMNVAIVTATAMTHGFAAPRCLACVAVPLMVAPFRVFAAPFRPLPQPGAGCGLFRYESSEVAAGEPVRKPMMEISAPETAALRAS